MSDEALGLIQRAAGLLSEKPLSDRRGFGPSKAWDEFEDTGHVAEPPPSSTIENEDVSPAGIFRVAWRYKFTLVGMTLLLIALAAAVILAMPSIYVPEALIVVGNREASSPQLRTGTDSFPPLADTATVQTEMEILRSRTLAAQVTDDLKLWKRQAFNPNIAPDKPPGILQQVLENFSGCVLSPFSCLREFAGRLLPGDGSETAAASKDPATEENLAVEIFLSKLNVSVKTNSRIISVQFEDRDPQLATSAVNGLVDHYIANHLVTTTADRNDATNWFDQTLGELQQRVAQSEQEYQRFRAAFGANGTRDFLDKKMAETSSQLEAAEIARNDAETRVTRLRAILGSNVADLATTDVANSPVMQSLRQKAADLHEQQAQLTSIFGDSHPKVQNIRAAIARSNQEMRAEVGRLVNSLEGDVRLASAKEASLRQILAKTQADIAQSSDSQKKLEALKAEAASNRAVLDAFQKRRIEAIGVSAKPPQHIDAEIVSHASVPQGPSKPKKTLLLAIAVVGSTMAGFGAAFAREKHDQTFRSSHEVEIETGLHPVALIPLTQKKREPREEILASSTSFYSETIRTLYMTLLLRQRFKMLVVTSARPGEGKTTLAASLALLAARSGRKVLLIDADLCTGGASRAFGLFGDNGLAELISGERQFSEVVGKGASADLDFHFLSCGTQKNAMAARSALENTLGLFRRLREEYDLVIVDTPPILAVSDAMALSTQSDATLFAVRWGMTPRAAVKLGLRRLLGSSRRRNFIGIVLTMVNTREHSRYGHEDSALYTKELVGYHSSIKRERAPTSLPAQQAVSDIAQAS
jgi:succinoglycan biosynthesis transport protein ExoP